ncbi:MAG: DUF2605 domain-containing protein [Jaaginema sp. PMC 1079.18]|nr:DUF2605 domain-containing protein [Jaaginema sp. PMC 1080.18]MEC4852103.1 DUF2605 domain-containing protein [Jaaginema sp. PMC 1079.18]MEC4866442.1 DUF2605 domain-containing protein [Jaaginema sp. PMC 1078.18]
MSLTQPPERELLKAVLEPLLADFQYWFARSRDLLENENITFLNPNEQVNLITRLKTAQQEVSAAQALFQATSGQAGLELSTIQPWHNLVTECWQVASQWRSLQQASESQ